MDRPAPAPPQHRDIVFCHGCENEWYRDEGGLECPECHSDFTEVVESDHDPREDDTHIPADDHPLRDHNPWNAPDPDEDDIDQFHFTRNEPGQPPGGTYRATINRTIELDAQGRPIGQLPGQGGWLSGVINNALQGLIGPALAQYQQQQIQQQQQQQQRTLGSPDPTDGQGRPASAPGSPRGEEQQGNGGTFTRHVQGPGYSFTMTSTTGNGGNLFPRNANGPQPYNAQPDNMEEIMRQMMMNIGAFPGMRGPGGMQGQRMGPGGFMFEDDQVHPGGGMAGGPIGFPAGLLQMLGIPGGGVHGDAVYSQEALDRIITQLMEQHQTGNAPGPASEAAIKSLPTRQLTEEDFGDDGKADCSICMEEVQLGETVKVLPCSHWFHGECIREWLITHDTCPHCRQGIMPKDENEGDRARQATQAPLHDMLHTQMPGGFPSTEQSAGESSSGSGTRDSHFSVPNSPNANRANGTSGARRPSAQSGNSSSGVFGRMRDAFGGGNTGNDGNRS